MTSPFTIENSTFIRNMFAIFEISLLQGKTLDSPGLFGVPYIECSLISNFYYLAAHGKNDWHLKNGQIFQQLTDSEVFILTLAL